ncbi:hypothetical protein BC940DRAFT_242760 [Gongronella butleri]|nr:hypothetical protein BC940DRAFT_242760 [Gongronella butleri]
MSTSESPSPSLQPLSVSTSSNNDNIPVESIASPASPAAPVAVNPTKSSIKRSKVGEDVFTESCVKTWQDSRIKAWEGRHLNPEGYYFRFVIPGEGQQNGGWSSKEHALFMERYEEWVAKGRKMGVAWGLFSRGIPHRVGYQCMNYYRKLLEKKKLKDDAYEVVNGKLKLVQREKSTSHVPIMELGPEWQADDVKEIERNVDQWLAKYHSRSGR